MRIIVVFFLGTSILIWAFAYSHPFMRVLSDKDTEVRASLQSSLAKSLIKPEFPEVVEFPISGGGNCRLKVRYTLDWELQKKMEKLLFQWKPDYAAFVALEVETGKVLSLVSYSRRNPELGNLTLQSQFPAASIFKIVTATAVFDLGMASPDTIFSFNGSNHSLYRRNVTSTRMNEWTRFMSIKKAFAKSVNTVFGKIGAH